MQQAGECHGGQIEQEGSRRIGLDHIHIGNGAVIQALAHRHQPGIVTGLVTAKLLQDRKAQKEGRKTRVHKGAAKAPPEGPGGLRILRALNDTHGSARHLTELGQLPIGMRFDRCRTAFEAAQARHDVERATLHLVVDASDI